VKYGVDLQQLCCETETSTLHVPCRVLRLAAIVQRLSWILYGIKCGTEQSRLPWLELSLSMTMTRYKHHSNTHVRDIGGASLYSVFITLSAWSAASIGVTIWMFMNSAVGERFSVCEGLCWPNEGRSLTTIIL